MPSEWKNATVRSMPSVAPTSSGRELIASVKRLLKELPGDVAVYPGHNDETTIEHEKRYNPLA